MILLAFFFSLIFLHGLLSGRLKQTILTPPILFTGAGALAFLILPQADDHGNNLALFLKVAEVGLVLLLFTDASRTPLRVLFNIRALPIRLLTVGMLLTIFLGGAFGLILFPGLTIWEAGILAAILAPTDAGLGQVIVNSPKVPLKIREALNVEAGLNDGLSVPFLLFFMALAGIGESTVDPNLFSFIWEQLGYGTLIGLGIGLLGGFLIAWAHRVKSIEHSWQQLAVIALPLLCATFSEGVGASMFIAAFIAGLSVQIGFSDAGKHCVEFTEQSGQLFNSSVFFLFGIFIAESWHQITWTHFAYAILSLTLIRMLPVGLSLIGTRMCRATVLFMGWFGPRGLASIVLGLVVLEHFDHGKEGDPTIRLAVMTTVFLSIIAHGISALPGMEIYARKIAALPPNAPERADATDGK